MKKLQHDLYRFKYRYAPYLPLSKPVDLMLELSSKCNQFCGYCYHSERNKDNLPFKLGYMDAGLAMGLISQGADIGIHSIKYNFRGESTLHPDYYRILKHAKNHASGMTYMDRIANSNFKIPKSRREDIFDALSTLTKVKVSFDSFNKEVFETQRAGGSYDLALENIDLFYSRIVYMGLKTKLVIQAVRTKLNKDEDIRGLAKSRWPLADVSIRDMVEGRINKDLNIYKVNFRDFKNRKTCIQAHARLVVLHDGMVQMCCPDIGSKIIIGDAKRHTLKEIFNSRKANEIRHNLVNKDAFKKNPCRTCSSYESFANYKAPKES